MADSTKSPNKPRPPYSLHSPPYSPPSPPPERHSPQAARGRGEGRGRALPVKLGPVGDRQMRMSRWGKFSPVGENYISCQAEACARQRRGNNPRLFRGKKRDFFSNRVFLYY